MLKWPKEAIVGIANSSVGSVRGGAGTKPYKSSAVSRPPNSDKISFLGSRGDFFLSRGDCTQDNCFNFLLSLFPHHHPGFQDQPPHHPPQCQPLHQSHQSSMGGRGGVPGALFDHWTDTQLTLLSLQIHCRPSMESASRPWWSPTALLGPFEHWTEGEEFNQKSGKTIHNLFNFHLNKTFAPKFPVFRKSP